MKTNTIFLLLSFVLSLINHGELQAGSGQSSLANPCGSLDSQKTTQMKVPGNPPKEIPEDQFIVRYWQNHPALPNGHVSIQTRYAYFSLWYGTHNRTHYVVKDWNADNRKDFVDRDGVEQETNIIAERYEADPEFIKMIEENINKVSERIDELPPGEAGGSMLPTYLGLAFSIGCDLNYDDVKHTIDNSTNCALSINNILFDASVRYKRSLGYNPETSFTYYVFNNMPTPFKVSKLRGNELAATRTIVTHLNYIGKRK